MATKLRPGELKEIEIFTSRALQRDLGRGLSIAEQVRITEHATSPTRIRVEAESNSASSVLFMLAIKRWARILP